LDGCAHVVSGRGVTIARVARGSCSASSRDRCPTANAGAPATLTMSVNAYQSNPIATAWPVETPRGWSNTASSPSRTPNPPTEIGTTCAIATAGTKAMTAAFGSPTLIVCTAQYTAETTEA